ncbi:PqiC family protein [bacterium]|nr:PqiC family protein [bacterium]
MKRFYYLIPILLLAACSSREFIPKNYYILEYYPHTEKKNLFYEKPMNYTVQVNDLAIPTTYNRKEIVIRHFGPRITYSDNDIWAVDLTEIIPNLIVKRISSYDIFRQVAREFLSIRPDYEIITKINNIEVYESENVKAARLSMDFALQERGAKAYNIEHSVNREVVLADNQMETFVQIVNEIILDETDKFLIKITHYFKGIPEEPKGPSKVSTDSLLTETSEELIEGMGILFFPAISGTDNEPPFIIYDKQSEELTEVPGKAVPLKAGTYSVKYGSGSLNQMILKENVKIVPRYKTILEADWSCLLVDVIDQKREVVKVQYEVFDSETGESYGTDIPAEREYGEQQKIWMLKPGLYKITINNEPFNTYRNFTTVYLKESIFQKLTIVVDTDPEGNPTDLIGAGILEKSELVGAAGNWRFLNAFYGNANFNSTNENIQTEHKTSITFNTQFENKITYDNFPFNYTLRNLIELGTTKTTDTDFRISNDNFYFRNTLIFYFLKNVGLYNRFDAESHMLNEYVYFSSPINYKKIDLASDIVETGHSTKQVLIKPGFRPITFKEGIGINLRAFNTGRINLNIRAGFGLRQDYYDNVFSLSDMTETTSGNIYKLFNAQKSQFKRGTELSLVGNFQLPLNLTYYTNADFLFPFRSDESTTIEWENVFNLKLFKYISLDYRLRLRNKQTDSGEDYIVDRHALFLRITYFLR